jgi:hypothetical protein
MRDVQVQLPGRVCQLTAICMHYCCQLTAICMHYCCWSGVNNDSSV